MIWRQHVLVWAAKNALRLDGDFVECACYRGTSARIVCDTLNFSEVDKSYYLYDLFDHDSSMPHGKLPQHSADLYAKVKQRFSDLENVFVTQGKVPDILEKVSPEKISFLHIDLNSVEAEIGALEVLFDRMVDGAVLILDDYGWLAYREQKVAEDAWLAKRGYSVLELPTGQGMVIK